MLRLLTLMLICSLFCAQQSHAVTQAVLERQAKQGQPSAMAQLGVNYYFGINVKKNYSEAYKYFSASANKNPVSAYYMGVMSLYGQGIQKDPAMAIKYLQMAADGGDQEALGLLGICYKRGDVIKKDYRKAFVNLSTAFSYGKKKFAVELGELYEAGNGTNKNIDKALSLYLIGKNEDISDSVSHILQIKRLSPIRHIIKSISDVINKMSFFDLLGIVSLISGYVFYKKSTKEKIPCYNYQTVSLISGTNNKFDGLEVFYKGQQVESLSISRVAFWNSGNETITSDDVSSLSPIAIDFNGSTVLDADIAYTNDTSSSFGFTISDDKQKVILTFDYIDEYCGAVYQILHTSLNNENKIALSGKIKGVKNISQQSLLASNKVKYLMTIGMIAVSILFGLMSYSVGTDLLKMEEINFLGLILCIATAIGSVTFILIAISIITKKSMKGFDINPADKLQ